MRTLLSVVLAVGSMLGAARAEAEVSGQGTNAVSGASFEGRLPNVSMLTVNAIEEALGHFYSKPGNTNALICRSVFTPGVKFRVGQTSIKVIAPSEVSSENPVSLVRISEVMIRDTDTNPVRLTVTVQLVTWFESGRSDLIGMRAFPMYEMTLDSKGKLKVVKENLTVE